MRAVNLLPVEDRGGRRRPPTPALAIAAAGVLAVSALTLAYVSASGQADTREQELGALEQDLATAKRAAKPAQPERPAASEERDQRLSALNDAFAKRLAWDRVLREVSLVLPEDVWLSNLTAGAPGATDAPAPTETPSTGLTLTFNGFTYSQESVARLMTRLALVPDLGNVKLQNSAATKVGQREIVGFTILADVTNPGGTP